MQIGNSSLLDARLAREALHGPVAVILADSLGLISWCNASAEKLLGCSLVALTGAPIGEYLHSTKEIASDLQSHCSIKKIGDTSVFAFHTTVARPTGDAHYLIPANGFVDQWADLKSNETMWRYALQASGHAVWDFKAAEGDKKAERNYYSENWRRMRGLSTVEAEQDNYSLWIERVHPDDRATAIENVALQDQGIRRELSYEYRERHSEGHYIWILARGKVCAVDEFGKPTHIVGVDVDISALKNAEMRQAEKAAEIYQKHYAELEKARNDAQLIQAEAEVTALKAQAWQQALETVGHGVWSYRLWIENGETRTEPLECSKRWHEMRGLDPLKTDHHAAGAWLSRVHPDDAQEAISTIARQHRGEQDAISFAYREKHAAGHWIWIMARGSVAERDEFNRPTLVVGIDIDISEAKREEARRSEVAKKLYDDHIAELQEERRLAELAHQRSEEFAARESIWRVAVDSTGHGVWSYNIIREGDAATTVVNYCSDAWYAIRGVEPGNTQIHELEIFYNRIHPNDLALLTQSIEKQIDGSEDEVSVEYRELHHITDKWVWILARGRTVERDEKGRASRVVGIDIDITQLKAEASRRIHDTASQHQIHIAELQAANDAAEKAQHEAQNMARLDMQTELANRRMFREQVNEALAADRPFAVLIIDLDHFKKINDVHGHAAGDFVLRETAKRLSSSIDSSAIVARLGGDEFGIVMQLPSDGGENAKSDLANRVIQSLQIPHRLADLVLEVGATIGSASSPTDGVEYDLLMHRADMALYQAKANQRGKHIVYTKIMGEEAEDRALLENDLRHAIAQKQIEPWFQPILSSQSGQIAKFEVLARWQHPTRGFVPPDKFIEIAEYLGLLPTLSTDLLQKACELASHWHGTKLSFNISAREASDVATPLHIFTILQQTRFDPKRLEVEITEQAFLDDLEAARSVVNNLRQVGIKVYVDDFGAGYAGIGYLRDLEVDGIKFDKSCVTEVCNKPPAAVFLKSLQLMASTMQLETVAEGIETAEVWSLVKQLNCDFGQGYLFSKALPAAQIEKLFLKTQASQRLITA